MFRFVCSVSVAVLLASLFSTGCGSSPATAEEPATLAEAGSQPFPLELAGGENVAWLLVSHDTQSVFVTWVMNPGWALDSASLCARGESFGWIDPALCERRIPAGRLGLPTLVVPFGELGGIEGACERAFYLQAQANVIEESTGGGANAYAGTFKGRIAFVPDCGRVVEGCTRTGSSWLDQSTWPIDGAKLGASTYSNVEMAALLETDPQSDASVLLARALIAATLNVAGGAEPATAVDPAFDEAQAWLLEYGSGARLPYGLKVTAEGAENLPGWDDGVNLAALLGRFDAGFGGARRCEP